MSYPSYTSYKPIRPAPRLGKLLGQTPQLVGSSVNPKVFPEKSKKHCFEFPIIASRCLQTYCKIFGIIYPYFFGINLRRRARAETSTLKWVNRETSRWPVADRGQTEERSGTEAQEEATRASPPRGRPRKTQNKRRNLWQHGGMREALQTLIRSGQVQKIDPIAGSEGHAENFDASALRAIFGRKCYPIIKPDMLRKSR